MAQDPEIQEISYNIQFLEEQADFLNEQQGYLSESLRGLRITLNTINELEQLPANHEIVLPIGNGAFLNAKVPDPSKILIAISKDLIMEKNIPDARVFTQKMIDNTTATLQNITEKRNQITKQLNSLKGTLNQRVGAGAGEQGLPSDNSE